MTELIDKASREWLRSLIRDVPDFPKPGIIFKDICPLLENPTALSLVVRSMAEPLRSLSLDRVLAIESRGFIFGAMLARELGSGLVLARKPKKLPYKTAKIEYALEYGNDSLEIHVDSLRQGHQVVIVDDILATGGTAAAAGRLVESVGAKVGAFVFLAELTFLRGRDSLKGYNINTLMGL